MHIDELKRWHWIVISLIVGLLLAWVYSGTAAEGGAGVRRTIGRMELIGGIGRTTDHISGKPLPILRNIKVYPPVDGKNVVTLEELVTSTDRQSGERTGVYEPRQLVAEIPFALTGRRPPRADWSILDQLNSSRDFYAQRLRDAEKRLADARAGNASADRIQQLERAVAQAQVAARAATPKYVALASKPWIYGLCVGGSFALIGLIWPTLLSRLASAGYAGPKHTEPAVDLSKVRSGPSKPTRPQAPTGPTAADLEKLQQVTAQYEQNVAGMTVPATDQGPAGATDAPQPQRKWETAPIEQQTPAAKVQEDDEIEVKGEFYPVLIHHKKQAADGDAKPDGKPKPDGNGAKPA